MGRRSLVPVNSLEELQERQADRVTAWARIFILMVCVGFIAVFARVVQLKVAPDDRLWENAGRTEAHSTFMTRRGDVYDRRGRIVATTTRAYDLYIDPEIVEDIDFIGIELEQLIRLNAADVEKAILDSKSRRYVVIARDLQDWQVDVIRNDAPRGVGLTPTPKRHYPNGEVGASIVGLVGTDHTGLGGFERRFDERLQPHDGSASRLTDRARRTLWVDAADYTPGTHGRDVRLSIDFVIQEMAEARLLEQVEKQNAAGGRVVVLDCDTGEILAICDIVQDRPGWDDHIDAPTDSIHPALNRNRCVTDTYEPGSTFKPFVWAAATELGRARPDELFPCPESPAYYTSQGRRIRDSHYYGPVDWRTVLIKSLNSGMAMAAERMSYDEMQRFVNAFGFGNKTRCGLPGESRGLVTKPADWSHYTQTSVCMGHEIAVTPVQMVRAFSVFCRDGSLPAVRMTAVMPGEGDHQFVRQVISSETAELTRRIMTAVVDADDNTKSSLYTAFGKSGTAQLPKKEGGGYFEDRYISSFIAGAPVDDPRIVVLTVIDDPDKKLGHYGRAVAGPVTRDLIDQALHYLGVAPDRQQPGDDDEPRPGRNDV